MIFDVLTYNSLWDLRYGINCHGDHILASVYEPQRSGDKVNYYTISTLINSTIWLHEPVKSGGTDYYLNWEEDVRDAGLLIFKQGHLEYPRLMNMKEGSKIIVAFPGEKTAYIAVFKKYRTVAVGNKLSICIMNAENGQEKILHCQEYERTWIAFPIE